MYIYMYIHTPSHTPSHTHTHTHTHTQHTDGMDGRLGCWRDIDGGMAAAEELLEAEGGGGKGRGVTAPVYDVLRMVICFC